MSTYAKPHTALLWLLCASLVCLPAAAVGQEVCPDGYEFFGGDDTEADPSLIQVGIIGSPFYQEHTLDTGLDEDWIYFGAVDTRSYTIQTIDLVLFESDIYMYAELYDENGTLLDCYRGSYDPNASITYFANYTGNYLVRLVDRNCVSTYPLTCDAPAEMIPGCTLGGNDADYRLKVTDNTGAPATVLPTVLSSAGGPVEGATVWATLTDTGQQFSAVPGDDPGEFIIDLTASGDCTVAADHRQYVERTVEFDCTGTKPMVITLEPGSDLPCGTMPLEHPPVRAVIMYYFLLLAPAALILLRKRSLRL